MKTATASRPIRKETDAARRRRLITGKSTPAPKTAPRRQVAPPWPAAPVRADLRTKSDWQGLLLTLGRMNQEERAAAFDELTEPQLKMMAAANAIATGGKSPGQIISLINTAAVRVAGHQIA